MGKFKFTSDGAEFPTYTVSLGDLVLGRVWRAWHRLGGEGWANNLAAGSGFATRQEAARDLLRRAAKEGRA